MGFLKVDKMDNYRNDNTARRYKAHVSILGTTQLHLRNPYIAYSARKFFHFMIFLKEFSPSL